MKDNLRDHMLQLHHDPVTAIRNALATVTGELARSFIRKSRVYPDVMHADAWVGPGPN